MNLSLYHLPRKSGPLSGRLLPFTHAWFPEREFDEVRQIELGLAARLGSAYIALLAAGPFEYRPEPGSRTGESPGSKTVAGARNEVVQAGYTTGWVCTVSSLSDRETFPEFLTRLEASRVELSAGNAGAAPALGYATAGAEYRLEFGGAFSVNGTPVISDHPRSRSIFCTAPREPDVMTISWEGRSLHLDYGAISREVV